MKIAIVAFFAAAAGLVAGDYVRCGTTDQSSSKKSVLNAFAANATNGDFRVAATRNVKTYVHVVTTNAKKGQFTQTQVNNQISVMNSRYSKMGVTYTLVSTDFTVNDAWASASDGSSAEYSMKSALHKGTYADLNLYLTSDLGGGLLGFCYFPESAPSSDDKILDGCICLASSMPNAGATNYQQGLTAVHEVGHWFGLYHVFQGSACSGAGDSVSDTPIQKTATSGCPSSQDSCPSQSGVDSIHNYMDYSYDACMTEFTAGQISRATSLYDQLRAGK